MEWIAGSSPAMTDTLGNLHIADAQGRLEARPIPLPQGEGRVQRGFHCNSRVRPAATVFPSDIKTTVSESRSISEDTWLT